eukprot:14807167-Heterocapsa_arctica.AAC.1
MCIRDRTSTPMPTNVVGAGREADSEALGRERRRGGGGRSRRCYCEIGELSMQNPAKCVIEKLKLPPGRQFDCMKK